MDFPKENNKHMENIMKKGTLTKSLLSLREKVTKYFSGRKLNITYSVLSPCYQLTCTVICGTGSHLFYCFYPVMKTNHLNEKKYSVKLSDIK